MTKKELQLLRDNYLNLILKISSNQYYKDFINFLFIENNFINDVDLNEMKYALDWYAESGEISRPLIFAKDLAYAIDGYGDYVYFALDPKNCFNKPKQCSFLINFTNIKKREYERAKNLLIKILDRKTPLSKNWFHQANSCWYGDFAKFGY